jgi:lysophospholipase L1-like esterase
MSPLERALSFVISAIVCIAILWPSVGFAQGCSGEVTTTTPAPPTSLSRRFLLHLKQLKYAVSADVDLILVGDSLAEAWDTKMFQPMSVVNLGVSGDRTQQVLWRLASPEWSKLRPRNVLIMLGTNNLSAGDPACAIIAGLIKVKERVASIWPNAQIGFLEITPRGQGFLDYNSVRTEINAAIRHIPDVRTFNVDDALTCGWQEQCSNYQPDHLHFSAAGYEVLYKSVKGVLLGKK